MEISKSVFSLYLKAGVLSTMGLSSLAFADGEPAKANYLDALLKQIDVAPIITGVVGVAGTIMGVAVVVMGIKKVARMLNAF